MVEVVIEDYIISTYYDSEDEIWIASCQQILSGSFLCHGDSPEDAALELVEAYKEYVTI